MHLISSSQVSIFTLLLLKMPNLRKWASACWIFPLVEKFGEGESEYDIARL